jgi:hypothetical protein
MNIPLYVNLQEAVTAALDVIGKNANILVLHQAAEILPVLSGEKFEYA